MRQKGLEKSRPLISRFFFFPYNARGKKGKEVINMTVLIIAAIIYAVIAMAMESVTAIIVTKLGVADPVKIFLMSAFWILIIPATVIYLAFFPKGHRLLAYILEDVFRI